MRAAIVLAALLVAATVRAEERPRRWEAELRASYVSLDSRRTSGLMPAGAARYAWPLDGRTEVTTGAELGALGLGGSAHWLTVIGGPTLGVRSRPWLVPVALGAELGFGMGRLTTCNRWRPDAFCMRYWGVFPSLAGTAAYRGDRYALGGSLAARYVSTWGWTGVSVEPAVSGVVNW